VSVRVRPNGAGIDRPVVILAVAAVVVTALGALWLTRAAVGGRPDYRTVRVDNRAALSLQVDAVDGDGARVGLGLAGPQATTTFQEVPDLGGTWTFVVSYGGQEVWHQAVGGRELAGRGWTVQVPDDVTVELEKQGYR
jgi:hypothetical protein